MRKDVLPLRRQRRQRLDGLAHLVSYVRTWVTTV